MKRFWFIGKRYFWTAFCKFSAKMAVKFPKNELFVSILDKALEKRTKALGEESVYIMLVINKWQQRARKCIVALNRNFKVLKGEEKV